MATLMPMPTMTRGMSSAERIPAIFLPPICTSLGHFSCACGTTSVTARPGARDSSPNGGGVSPTSTTMLMASCVPFGETHCRSSRPLPAVCSSAMSTVPGSPSLSKSALVDPVDSTHRTSGQYSATAS